MLGQSAVRVALRLVLVAAAAIAFTPPAKAADPYAGKQITLVASTESGSGYDLYARTVARWLPNHIPGHPSIVVQNMPGASGLRASNFLYNVAPKDGLTIGLVNNGNPFAPLYGMSQAQFDPTKFNWLGSPTKEVSVFLLWHTVPVNSIAEAKSKGRELILGSAGAATGGAFYSRILTEVFGIKIKTVSGYKGLAEALLAMERGENEGYASTFWSTLQSTRADWIRDKKIKFMLRYSGDAQPGLEGVPLATDIAKNDDDRQLLRIIAAPFDLGRPMLAPPAIPAENARLLKDGVFATTQDPEFRADCAHQNLDCSSPSSGDQIATIIADTYRAPDAVKKRLLALYKAE
jgi:tripartite-type tricarboxylate transporter receptor subunit TctC